MIQLSAMRVSLLGFALMTIPALAIGQAAHRQYTGTPVRIAASADFSKRSALVPTLDVTTPLHRLNLTELSGDDHFQIGTPAYIFLKNSGSNIWYPFAALNYRPEHFITDKDTVMLAGIVTEQSDNTLTLSYDFDEISPPAALERRMRIHYDQDLALGLSITKNGRSAVIDIYVNGNRFDQRIIPKLALRGGNKLAASIAPPT